MSVSGLCGICQAATAQTRCDRCGTLACDEHYDRQEGICADCASELRKNRGVDREDLYRF